MSFDQSLERHWGFHFHLIAPSVQEPCHFEVTRSCEPHSQGTVVMVLEYLIWMEVKASGALGSLRSEAPYDFPVFFGAVKGSEGSAGK
jgi:hypothetical protein